MPSFSSLICVSSVVLIHSSFFASFLFARVLRYLHTLDRLLRSYSGKGDKNINTLFATLQKRKASKYQPNERDDFKIVRVFLFSMTILRLVKQFARESVRTLGFDQGRFHQDSDSKPTFHRFRAILWRLNARTLKGARKHSHFLV